MNWTIVGYVSDVGVYFVTRRGVNDWTVLDPSSTIYDGFTDQNSAMSFAESLQYQTTNPPPQVSPSQVSPTPKVAPLEIPAPDVHTTSESR